MRHAYVAMNLDKLQSRMNSPHDQPTLHPAKRSRRTITGFAECVYRILVILSLGIGPRVEAATLKSFSLGGVNLVLEDAAADLQALVDVSSFHLNAADNTWSVNLAVSNKTTRVVRGPQIVLIDSAINTTGFLAPDGLDGSAPSKPIYDLTPLVPPTGLDPRSRTEWRTVRLGGSTGTPQLTLRAFASTSRSGAGLAFVRTLDDAGHPLAEVSISETGPAGRRVFTSDSAFGVASLGQGISNHVWQFSRNGFLPVWRAQSLTNGDIALVPSPRLTLRNAESVQVSAVLGGSVSNKVRGLQLDFSPGTFETANPITLTALTSQSLPYSLPLGWSPMQAFWVEWEGDARRAVEARLAPWGSISPGEAVVLARLNTTNLNWEAVQLRNGNEDQEIAVTFGRAGAYALCLADTGLHAPASPLVGQSLSGAGASFTNAHYALLTASGSLNPGRSVASLNPDLVTAIASVSVSNSTLSLPSGLLLRGEFSENYDLRAGGRIVPPLYDTFLNAYQRPGDGYSSTLDVSFPLRPVLLYTGDELSTATIQAEVFVPSAFRGTIMDTNGGLATEGGIRLLAAAGQLGAAIPVELRSLEVSNFVSFAQGDTEIVAAFQLTLPTLTAGKTLTPQFRGHATNSDFVLARIWMKDGFIGVEPVERFRSDGVGVLTSVEPGSGNRLPGVGAAGQYLLFKVSAAQGLISGIVRDSQGQPSGGLAIKVVGRPWMTSTDAGGRYALLAPAGAVNVSVLDRRGVELAPATGLMSDVRVGLSLDLGTAPAAPRVLAVSPIQGATNIPLVTAVTVRFSKPINPGAVGTNGIQLLGSNQIPVEASISFNLRGDTATLLPLNPLATLTTHTIQVSGGITDVDGLPVSGATQFRFTTVAESVRLAAAQLVSYEPTNGMVLMVGSQGTADAGVPVILVNETTGRTTTVLSHPDGSFSGKVEAGVDDVLTAVFVNSNQTRIEINVVKQLFADGSVALFRGGGTISIPGERGPIDFLIEAGAIASKTKLKFDSVTTQDLQNMLSGLQPADGGKVLGGFVAAKPQGSPLSQSIDVRFPVSAETLGLPQGVNPQDIKYGLAVVRQFEGETVFDLVDTMQYTNGLLVTHSPPMPGVDLYDPLLGPLIQLLFTPIILSMGETRVIAGKVFRTKTTTEDGINVPEADRTYLAGAVIYANTPGTAASPKRLRPGAVIATSRSKGDYSISVSVNPLDPNRASALRATHPSIPGEFMERILPEMNLLTPFSALYPFHLIHKITPDFANRPPEIRVRHSPDYPSTVDSAKLTLEISDNVQMPKNPEIEWKVTPLVNGDPDLAPSDFEHTIEEHTEVGPLGYREIHTVSCKKPAIAEAVITAQDVDGNTKKITYSIVFGGVPQVLRADDILVDKNDKRGPYVVRSEPPEGGSISAYGGTIVLYFNEAISPKSLETAGAVVLSGGSASGDKKNPTVTLQLDPDFHTLRVYPGKLDPGKDYTLTAQDKLQDLNGNALDQDPTTAGVDKKEAFSLSFKTQDATSIDFPPHQIQNAGGVVLAGGYAFVIDRRAAQNGKLLIYKTADMMPADATGGSGGSTAKPIEISVPPFPRDTCLIPHYSYKRHKTGAVETRDLLAIVGGRAGEASAQYLAIYDIGNPESPERIAGGAIRVDAATVTHLSWEPPVIAYSEITNPDSVGVIDLQTYILAIQATREERTQWPRFGKPGVDANRDGDYVDEGDTLPEPAIQPIEFAGKVGSFGSPDTSQPIFDYAIAEGGQFIGVVLGAAGADKAAFRTILSGDLTLQKETATYEFAENLLPRRLATLFQFPLEQGGAISTLDLIIVSVREVSESSQPGAIFGNRLMVLDVSDRLTKPRLIGEVGIPKEYGDQIFSIHKRSDGMLLLATGQDGAGRELLLIDPKRFGAKAPAQGVTHPAILGVYSGMGASSWHIGMSDSGELATADAGKATLLRTLPTFEFVDFVDHGSLLNPQELVLKRPTGAVYSDEGTITGEWSSYFDALQSMETLFEKKVVRKVLTQARVHKIEGVTEDDLGDRKVDAHHYVLVTAPGGLGETIDIALESLNWRGQPLRPLGSPFPPVHALAGGTIDKIKAKAENGEAEARSCKATRLSDKPGSRFYNYFLTAPLALVGEPLSPAEIKRYQKDHDREILWSGNQLRACFDLTTSERSLAKTSATELDAVSGSIIPRVYGLCTTLPGEYIQPPEPGPLVGLMPMPVAMDAVMAQNFDFVLENTDLTFPGRRLGFGIMRRYSAQSIYEGIFGSGWEFNFNQRLVEVKSGLVREKGKYPITIRSAGDSGPPDLSRSDVAEAGDLLFFNGGGRTLLYKCASTSIPDDIRDDPLLKEESLGWEGKIECFFIPPDGIFDLIFKFRDGTFVRLNPDGLQYWYNQYGRLTKVYDRYGGNSLQVFYNAHGELTEIQDELSRRIQFGYYRLSSDDALFRKGIDEVTKESILTGRCARIKDYADRDVVFSYQGRFLQFRDGVVVKNSKGEDHRQRTEYVIDSEHDCVSGLSADGDAFEQGGQDQRVLLAEFENVTVNGVSSKAVKHIEMGGPQNSCSFVSNGSTEKIASMSDGATWTLTLDQNGLVKESTLSAPDSPALTTRTEYYDSGPQKGLIKSVAEPEGNKTQIDYETDSSVPRRSKGNVRVIKSLDSSGSEESALQLKVSYDSRFNQPMTVSDPAGNIAAFALRNDGKDPISITMGGKTETYDLNQFGQIKAHSSPAGVITSIEYEEMTGFAKTVTDGNADSASAAVTSYAYDGSSSKMALLGMPSSVTEGGSTTPQPLPPFDGLRLPQGPPGDGGDTPIDRASSTIYDARGLPTHYSRGLYSVDFEYDASGRLTQKSTRVEQGRTLRESYAYDKMGFMTEQTMHQVETREGFKDLTTVYVPDAQSRVKEIHHPGGATESFNYDYAGRLASRVVEGGATTQYTYDKNGDVATVTVGAAKDRYIYDSQRRLSSVDTADGAHVSYTYDKNGNVTEVKQTKPSSNPQVVGQLISQINYTFDELNRRTSETIVRDAAPAAVTRYAYTKNLSAAGPGVVLGGQRVEITSPSLSVARIYYELGGRVSKVEGPTRSVVFTYDDRAQTVTAASTENGRTYTSTTFYNALGQIVKVRDNAGADVVFSPELDGRVMSTVDREGNTSYASFTILGEPRSLTDSLNLTLSFSYDERRNVIGSKGPANNEFVDSFDSLNRIASLRLPNTRSIVYSEYNELGFPKKAALPRGITVDTTYDPLGRPKVVVHSSQTWGPRTTSRDYDPLGRLSLLTGTDGEEEMSYSLEGGAKAVRAKYRFRGSPASLDFETTLAQSLSVLGRRESLTYGAGGPTLSLGSDASGRLVDLRLGSSDVLIKSTEYSASELIGGRTFGDDVIHMSSSYDLVKRPTKVQFVRATDQKTLVDIRYAYDKNGNQVVRQWGHLGWQADFFQYEHSRRLTRADVGARLYDQPQEAPRNLSGFSVPNVSTGGQLAGIWAPGRYAEIITYGNFDFVSERAFINPDTLAIPTVATAFASPDQFVFLQQVDGFQRGSDDVGNCTRTLLAVQMPGRASVQVVPANLEYNDLNQLVRVLRDDGVIIENQYNVQGFRMRRKVTGDPTLCVPSDIIFVYDGSLIIEERDFGTRHLLARYYYAEDDSPCVSDVWSEADDLFHRHYLLRDPLGSVVGIAGESGDLEEQIRYDVGGQPVVTIPDASAPRISRVLTNNADVIVIFTERILPNYRGQLPESGLVSSVKSLSEAVRLEHNGSPLSGSWAYAESYPGVPFGSALVMHPAQAIPEDFDVVVAGGALVDESSNPIAAERIAISTTSGPVAYTGPPSENPSSRTLPRARTPFLFHGQYYDFDAGLIYLRARYYDPFTGSFLQPDPAPFKDSLNHYAGFANNPVNVRDPSGTEGEGQRILDYVVDGIAQTLAGIAKIGENAAAGWEGMSNVRSTADVENAIASADLILADVTTAAGIVKASPAIARGLVRLGSSAIRMASPAGKAIRSRVAGFLEQRKGKRRSTQELRELMDSQRGVAKSSGSIAMARSSKYAPIELPPDTGKNYCNFIDNSGHQYLLHGFEARGEKLAPQDACFIAGTLVASEKGLIPIEEVRVGDFVWSADSDSGRVSLQQVHETFCREAIEIVELGIGGEIIRTTEEHPFWVPGKGWTPAGELECGTALLDIHGKVHYIEYRDLTWSPCSHKVYNLTVESLHSYFVSNIGVLVHNVCATQAQKNKSTGNRARDDVMFIEIEFEGNAAATEMFAPMPWGARFIDVLSIGKDKWLKAIEVKVGKTSLTSRVLQELEGDSFLLANKHVNEVVWRFEHSRTGVGPTAPLLEQLRQRGFTVIVGGKIVQ